MTRSVWKGPFIDGYLLKKAASPGCNSCRASAAQLRQIIGAASPAEEILCQSSTLERLIKAMISLQQLLIGRWWSGLLALG